VGVHRHPERADHALAGLQRLRGLALPAQQRVDPYPFILLNLLFSTQAAYAAPLILLSQNRTAERDRVKAEHDFDVNVLALRTLAELLGDVHDPDAQRDLRRRINDLLGRDPDRAEPVSRPQ